MARLARVLSFVIEVCEIERGLNESHAEIVLNAPIAKGQDYWQLGQSFQSQIILIDRECSGLTTRSGILAAASLRRRIIVQCQTTRQGHIRQKKSANYFDLLFSLVSCQSKLTSIVEPFVPVCDPCDARSAGVKGILQGVSLGRLT